MLLSHRQLPGGQGGAGHAVRENSGTILPARRFYPHQGPAPSRSAIRSHSLEERYPSHAGYVNAVAAAADNLRRERLLLDGDVDAVLRKAQEAPVGR